MTQSEGIQSLSFTRRKNTVILGPAGSGKTELAVAVALALREEAGQEILVFDLDQTKTLFRLRDIAPALESQRIQVIHGDEFMDSPLVPGGVAEALANPGCRVILDVGGDQNGARSLGQYRDLLEGETTQILLPINPFRRPGLTTQALWENLQGILSWIGREKVRILCNPWRGKEGGAEAAVEGANRLTALLAPLGLDWEGILLSQELWGRVSFPGKGAVRICPRVSEILDIR